MHNLELECLSEEFSLNKKKKKKWNRLISLNTFELHSEISFSRIAKNEQKSGY